MGKGYYILRKAGKPEEDIMVSISANRAQFAAFMVDFDEVVTDRLGRDIVRAYKRGKLVELPYEDFKWLHDETKAYFELEVEEEFPLGYTDAYRIVL